MSLLQAIGRLLLGSQQGPQGQLPPMPQPLVPGSQSPVMQAFANSTGVNAQPEPYDDTGGPSGPPMVQNGVNTEAPQVAVPTPDAGPSMSVPAAAVPPHHKGGILGALGSVFMPKADSLWAGALRNGLARAHESQDAYRAEQAATLEKGRQSQLETQTASAKLQSLLRNGEYRTVGNNVLHIPTDGSAPSFIPIPQNPSENERLLELWRVTPPGEYRDHIEMALKGADNNPKYDTSDSEEASKIRVGTALALARAKATAQYRAPRVGRRASGSGLSIPSGYKVIK